MAFRFPVRCCDLSMSEIGLGRSPETTDDDQLKWCPFQTGWTVSDLLDAVQPQRLTNITSLESHLVSDGLAEKMTRAW